MEFLPLVALALLFWVFVLRPQRARAKEQQELITSLEPGDEIVTAGGLYGTITAVDGEVLHVEIAPDVEVRVDRRAIAGVVRDEEPEEEEAAPANQVEPHGS